MNIKNDNLEKEKQSRKIFYKRNRTKTLPIANKITSPRTNYLKSYSNLNELMRNNDYDKADDAPEYKFVDDWSKHE